MTDSVGKFCQLWSEGLAAVLRQTGMAGTAASEDAPKPIESATQQLLMSGVHARFVGGGALKGELAIACEAPVAVSLAQAFKCERLDATVKFGSSHRDAFLELVRQVAAVAATEWKSEVGREVLISFHSAAEPPFAGVTEVAIEVHGETFAPVVLKLALNKELNEILSAQPEAPGKAAPPAQAAQTPQRGTGTESHFAIGTVPPLNLDLLLDVNLEATIRFGEREMLLREIYGLMPGTVIELDQLINEPAQLLVAGRTVAWGEVVVVDGNFGLRVTQVASKGQRAEMLRL